MSHNDTSVRRNKHFLGNKTHTHTHTHTHKSTTQERKRKRERYVDAVDIFVVVNIIDIPCWEEEE